MSSSNYNYQVVNYGQAFVIRGTFTDAYGTGFTPGTVALWITEPTGTTFLFTKVQHGTVVKEFGTSGSIWEAIFAANHKGYWTYHWEGTSDGQPIAQDHKPFYGAYDGRVFVRYGNGTP